MDQFCTRFSIRNHGIGGLVLLASAPAMLASGAAMAQGFPSKPIVWVVPFTPGGITDITSRLISKHVGTDLGQ